MDSADKEKWLDHLHNQVDHVRRQLSDLSHGSTGLSPPGLSPTPHPLPADIFDHPTSPRPINMDRSDMNMSRQSYDEQFQRRRVDHLRNQQIMESWNQFQMAHRPIADHEHAFHAPTFTYNGQYPRSIDLGIDSNVEPKRDPTPNEATVELQQPTVKSVGQWIGHEAKGPRQRRNKGSNRANPYLESKQEQHTEAEKPKGEETEEEKSKLDTTDVRPNVSYVWMIQKAIEATANGKATLGEVYMHIEDTYPYFKKQTGKKRQSWQNSVRHNLSLNDCFIKVVRDAISVGQEEGRKGNYWTLDENCVDQFEPGNCKRRRRMNKRPSRDGYGYLDGQNNQMMFMLGQHTYVNWSDFIQNPNLGMNPMEQQHGQEMVGHNGSQANIFGQSASAPASLMNMPMPHSAFQNYMNHQPTYDNSNSNACFLPSANTLVGRPCSGPGNLRYYPQPQYNSGSFGSY